MVKAHCGKLEITFQYWHRMEMSDQLQSVSLGLEIYSNLCVPYFIVKLYILIKL
jgi:hypothetical protein